MSLIFICINLYNQLYLHLLKIQLIMTNFSNDDSVIAYMLDFIFKNMPSMTVFVFLYFFVFL